MEQSIRVSWTDDSGLRHEDDDAELLASARDAVTLADF